jgi:HSP20 family protein
MTLVKFNNGTKERGLNPFVNDVFESLFNDSFISDRLTSRVPAVNIAETDNEFYIELAAPGLKKEHFKINVEKNILNISAESKTENNEQAKKYNRREYSYNSFVRSFTLPEVVDHSRIEAEYVDGVLKINIAKKEEAKNFTKEIAVK